MASIKDTRDAIKALPGMTAVHTDGEWRVTVSLYRLSDRHPGQDTAWCEEKQEALAYYTSDADDALRTARDMSMRWMDEGFSQGMSVDERKGHAQDALLNGTAVPLKDGRWMALAAEPNGRWSVEIRETRDAVEGAVGDRSGEGLIAGAAARFATKVHGDAINFERQEQLLKVIPRQQAMAAADDVFQRELERVYGRNAGDARYLQRHDDPAVERARAAYHKASDNWHAASSAARDQQTQQFIAGMKGQNMSTEGSYKVRPEDLTSFNQREDASDRHLTIIIESTGNAAFVDTGREQEVARIIEAAADQMDDLWGREDGDRYPLHDLNGNKVGHLAFSTGGPGGSTEGDFWLDVECQQDGDDPAHAAAQHLREAALQVGRGQGELVIHDVNGNRVGMGTLRPLPSLEKDGVIDMSAALGDVYLAEDGYSGIADGEYRYVVPTNGFEPGYHQGEGDAWLVNAKGEKAPGYDEPQTVRESDIRALKPDERVALRDVVEGRVTFEDFERSFDSDEPELG